MAIIREILETTASVMAALFLLWAFWCITDAFCKLGRASLALVEAYKDRTKLLGAQFAETTRAYREVGAAKDRLPSAAEMWRDQAIKQEQAADAQRLMMNQQGRTTLPPVGR